MRSRSLDQAMNATGLGVPGGGQMGLKSLFHKLETYGGQCLQIPVFTGMTGFGAALRVVGKNDVANRRAVYGPTLERGLLKQALETHHYGERRVPV